MENVVESKEMISFIDSIKTSLRKFITSLLEMVIMVCESETQKKKTKPIIKHQIHLKYDTKNHFF